MPASDPILYSVAFTLACTLVVVIAFAARTIRSQRARLQSLEAQLRTLLAERPQIAGQQLQDGRNSVLFEQHRRMNDLQISKLAAEVELLGRQVKASGLNDDRIEAGKEYHELMVEKTKLEMDSLRLHIAELRRRIEDWRFGDE